MNLQKVKEILSWNDLEPTKSNIETHFKNVFDDENNEVIYYPRINFEKPVHHKDTRPSHSEEVKSKLKPIDVNSMFKQIPSEVVDYLVKNNFQQTDDVGSDGDYDIYHNSELNVWVVPNTMYGEDILKYEYLNYPLYEDIKDTTIYDDFNTVIEKIEELKNK